MPDPVGLVAILPCNDLGKSEAFYGRLGFFRVGDNAAADYRILADAEGRLLHLAKAVEGWLVPGRNPFGLYLYTADVDGLAARFGERPEHKQPWGTYEFALSDPDETLVRIGCVSRSRPA